MSNLLLALSDLLLVGSAFLLAVVFSVISWLFYISFAIAWSVIIWLSELL